MGGASVSQTQGWAGVSGCYPIRQFDGPDYGAAMWLCAVWEESRALPCVGIVSLVKLVSITSSRIPEAASALARAMLDEPGGRWLFPDPGEFIEVNEQVFIRSMGRALGEGRVDAWDDPFVGVAVWFEQSAIGEESPRQQPTSGSSPFVPDHATARVEEFDMLLKRVRRLARPDRHVYLDTIGVLPNRRRQGVATELLEAGFTWADDLGLPCSLDTLDPENVAFYRRRGFDVLASEPLPGSDLTITSMRRLPHT